MNESLPLHSAVLFGYATTIIPRIYTYYVSTALFAIFGVRMLREGLRMSPDEGQEELEEVQAEIKKKDEEVSKIFTSQPRKTLLSPAHQVAQLQGDYKLL